MLLLHCRGLRDQEENTHFRSHERTQAKNQESFLLFFAECEKNLLGCEEAAAGRAGILTAAEEGKQNNRMQVTKQRKKMSKIGKLKTINHARFLQVEAED